MRRENVASVLSDSVSRGKSFIRTENPYLCEKILSTLTRSFIDSFDVSVETYSSPKSYWGFDFSRFYRCVSSVGGLERLELDVRNGFGDTASSKGVKILYQPSKLVKRHGRGVLKSYRSLLKDGGNVLIIDRGLPPRSLLDRFDRILEVRKEGKELLIEGDSFEGVRRLKLYGQTSLPDFKSSVRA